MVRLVLAGLLVAACGGKSEPPPSGGSGSAEAAKPADAAVARADAAAPPDAASAQPDLAVTLDGKPIAIQSAIAVDRTGGEVAIELASFPHTCKEELANFRDTYPDEFELRLRIGKYLAKDGTLGWAIRGRYLSTAAAKGKTTQSEKEAGGDPLAAGTAIDPAAGATFALPLELAWKLAWEAPLPQELAIKGTVKVESCGEDKSRSKDPPPEPLPGGGTIEIAGQKLPIGGAGFIATREGDRVLQLSTHPVKCVEGSSYTTSRGDVELELAWNKAGKLYRVEREGAWVDWGANQSGDIALTARPNRAPRGAKQLKIRLGGAADVDGYPVALSGTVPAIVCPTPR